MRQIHKFWIVFTILTYFLEAHGADKYTDENRPYEFGFNIDGEQHRHEKKDENGIIMGEFGFITADGVYHVTVYATDENGNFKILSMKNIRKKPYPTAATTPARQGNSLPFPPSQNPPKTQGPVPQQPKPAASPARSCSHCSLPTTTTKAPPALTDYANVARDEQQYPNRAGNSQVAAPAPAAPGYHDSNYNDPFYREKPGSPANVGSSQGGFGANSPNGPGGNYPQGVGANSPNGPGGNYPQGGANYPQGGAGANYPQSGPGQSQGASPNYNQPGQGPNYPPQQDLLPPNEYPQGAAGPSAQYPGPNSDRNPKRIDDYPQGDNTGRGSARGPPKPTLISAQMSIVDKNIDIYHKNPGEKDGLPQGLNKDDMVQLLYTFNYTVGFHAHFEEGYTNGSKQGYYYVTGRNGVRTRVDYVADEKGFRPKITQEVLDLISDDVPKPETEKDEKYGLKGYEFKWLYYPVESKGQ